MSHRILILSRHDRSGGGSRVRMLDYAPYLQDAGWQVDTQPFFDESYLVDLYGGRRPSLGYLSWRYALRIARLMKLRPYDLVWIEKETLPYIPSLLETLFLGRAPYALDYDDAWFHRYDLNPRKIVRWSLGNKLDQLMSRANMVVVGNAYLASRALSAGASHVEILPSVIKLSRYTATEPKRDGPVVIGWIGSPSTAVYLQHVADQLRQACAGGRAIVRLIGSGPIDLPGVPHEVLNWSEETECEELCRFDIGIMPMVDGPWERGKCGYKLIQYMASGRPMIASPVGVNRNIVEHGVNGLLAETPGDWLTALNALIDSPELCASMGAAGRAKVETFYTLDSTAPRLIGALQCAMTGSRAH